MNRNLPITPKIVDVTFPDGHEERFWVAQDQGYISLTYQTRISVPHMLGGQSYTNYEDVSKTVLVPIPSAVGISSYWGGFIAILVDSGNSTLTAPSDPVITKSSLLDFLKENLSVQTSTCHSATEIVVRTRLALQVDNDEIVISEDEDSVDISEMQGYL